VTARRQLGVTLIELVAFIVIVGVVVAGLMAGFSSTVRSAATPQEMTQGLQLAQGRLELIFARKQVLGFAGFTGATFDPCAPPAGAQQACLAPAGYTVTTSLATDWGGDTNYKVVTVQVTGLQGGQLAELTALVANY
jgi:MSHA pilin protein MshD